MKTYKYRFRFCDDGQLQRDVPEGRARPLGDFASEGEVERLFDVVSKRGCPWKWGGSLRDVEFDDGSYLDDWSTATVLVHRSTFDSEAFACQWSYDVTIAVPPEARYAGADH